MILKIDQMPINSLDSTYYSFIHSSYNKYLLSTYSNIRCMGNMVSVIYLFSEN